MGRLLAAGIALIVAGCVLSAWIQTDGGNVRVLDVRFVDAQARAMSGLLYVPHTATPATPAPAVLAVHGYINSRETQSPFAIEFARRGYVVLAIDQTGHGFSAPPAFAAGFGGPAGLAYLRSLAFVDRDNIGLEGHSMGGWAILSAAAQSPDDYRAMVLEGSTTGAFGVPDGTTTWPRNVAVVFSTWDEFAELMWGVARGRDVVFAPKLKTMFGTTLPVVAQRTYGDIHGGTARILYQPATTHPGDHLSPAAVAAATDWFGTTLTGARPVPDQRWYFKEFGTLLALLGLFACLVAGGRLLLRLPMFAVLAGPAATGGRRRWPVVLQLAILPALTYLPLFVLAEHWLTPSAIWPQQITNALMLWLLGNALLALIGLAVAGFEPRRQGLSWPDGRLNRRLVLALLLAVATVALGYALLALADALATVDFRFWVIAVKLLAPWHLPALLAYLPILLVGFVLLGAAAAPLLTDGSVLGDALRLAGISASGFVVLLLVQYVPLLAGGSLPLAQPLLTIVAFQFLVLLAFVGVVTAVFLRATGTVYVGAFINALFVGWVVVAGQATQVG